MTRWLRVTMRVAVMAGMGFAGAGAASAQAPSNLPFSSIYRRPNVSPYMQMSQQGLNPMQGQSAYQT